MNQRAYHIDKVISSEYTRLAQILNGEEGA